jgi:hypothetical protein
MPNPPPHESADPLMSLIACLNEHRAHVISGIDGLTEEQLDLVAAPSGWTLRGIVSHLLYDVEIFWLGAVLMGDPEAIGRLRDGWTAPRLPVATLRTEYVAAAARADVHLQDVGLSSAPAWQPSPEVFSAPLPPTALDVILRVLSETATHAGHIDMARESIDGRQYLTLD